MKIQGWGIQAAAVSYTGFPVSSDYGYSKPSLPHKAVLDELSAVKGENRSELLKLIKSRIKAGFYSTDAVIDDIGHGFAQALDQSL